MKNNTQNHIIQGRENRNYKAAINTDILASPSLIQHNQQRLNQKPRRKRRIDYAKKILNDPLIFSI